MQQWLQAIQLRTVSIYKVDTGGFLAYPRIRTTGETIFYKFV
jgi:hypothetical protein